MSELNLEDLKEHFNKRTKAQRNQEREKLERCAHFIHMAHNESKSEEEKLLFEKFVNDVNSYLWSHSRSSELQNFNFSTNEVIIQKGKIKSTILYIDLENQPKGSLKLKIEDSNAEIVVVGNSSESLVLVKNELKHHSKVKFYDRLAEKVL